MQQANRWYRNLAETSHYIMKAEINLLSRGAKPGNSGGPVVNKYGQCIGVVTADPGEADGDSSKAKADILGYGFAIHAREIRNFISHVNSGSAHVQGFQQDTDGYVVMT